MALAKETKFTVATEKTSSSLEVMDELLQKGSKEDILNFFRVRNIFNPKILNIQDVYYLLSDEDFYLKLVDILR